MAECGILCRGALGHEDEDGCRRPKGHAEPHEFVDQYGAIVQWETDLECDCDHCMKAEGDYCFTYWTVSAAKQGSAI